MRHLHTDPTSHHRVTATAARLFGAGLAATVGLTVFGGFTSASFAATASLPDVTPVVCPAGMTCPTPPPDNSGTPGDHHVTDTKCPKDHKDPKDHKHSKHHKDPKDCKTPNHPGLSDFLQSTNTDPGGVKWH